MQDGSGRAVGFRRSCSDSVEEASSLASSSFQGQVKRAVSEQFVGTSCTHVLNSPHAVHYCPMMDSWVRAEEVVDSGPTINHHEREAVDEWNFRKKDGKLLRLLLFLLALIASTLSFGVDRVVQLDSMSRDLLGEAFPVLRNMGPSDEFVVDFVGNTVGLFAAVIIVHRYPQAAGSGLPEVKCILSGLPMAGFLDFKVLVAKFAGLSLVLAAQLPVGKEGPFVHIAACVSHWLLQSRPFRDRGLDANLALLAAVSVGVGATFSAPISGVLFAVEIMMPRLYETHTYFSCLFASTMGTLTFMALNMFFFNSGLKPLFNSDISPTLSPNLHEECVFIFLCVILGAACGASGALFVRGFVLMQTRLIQPLRGVGEGAWWLPCFGKARALRRDLALVALVSLLAECLKLCGGIHGLNMQQAGPLLTELFSTGCCSLNARQLIELLSRRWVMTTIALTMPVPCGVVAPTLVLGAMLGRLYVRLLPEQLLQMIASNGNVDEYAARLAMVGATCFSGSVCRVVSVVVTVFEVVSVPKLILPLMLATMAANWAGNRIGPSFFDAVLMMKRVPAFPTLAASRQALETVKSRLQPPIADLAMSRYGTKEDVLNTIRRIQDIDREKRAAPTVIPIVEYLADGSMVLCSTIPVTNLMGLQRACQPPPRRWKNPVDMKREAISAGALLRRSPPGSPAKKRLGRSETGSVVSLPELTPLPTSITESSSSKSVKSDADAEGFSSASVLQLSPRLTLGPLVGSRRTEPALVGSRRTEGPTLQRGATGSGRFSFTPPQSPLSASPLEETKDLLTCATEKNLLKTPLLVDGAITVKAAYLQIVATKWIDNGAPLMVVSKGRFLGVLTQEQLLAVDPPQ